MLRILLAAAALTLVAAPSSAAPCKDAKGRFTKCPTSNIVKGKDGKCRISAGAGKGKFAKCP